MVIRSFYKAAPSVPHLSLYLPALQYPLFVALTSSSSSHRICLSMDWANRQRWGSLNAARAPRMKKTAILLEHDKLPVESLRMLKTQPPGPSRCTSSPVSRACSSVSSSSWSAWWSCSSSWRAPSNVSRCSEDSVTRSCNWLSTWSRKSWKLDSSPDSWLKAIPTPAFVQSFLSGM